MKHKKLPKTFNILPKWWKFAISDHTVADGVSTNPLSLLHIWLTFPKAVNVIKVN